MNPQRNIAKAEKILLALTAAFLCLLLPLYLRDRQPAGEAGVAAEADGPPSQEVFLPDPAPVDLNTASAEELADLPGIGPVLAERIVAYRLEHGPFPTEEALLEVSGIGPAKLSALEGRIIVSEEK